MRAFPPIIDRMNFEFVHFAQRHCAPLLARRARALNSPNSISLFINHDLLDHFPLAAHRERFIFALETIALSIDGIARHRGTDGGERETESGKQLCARWGRSGG